MTEVYDYYLQPKIINYEERFASTDNPIVLNNYVSDSKFTDRIISAITIEQKDKSLIYSCECGNLEGVYYEGFTCPICNTKVEIQDELRNNVWVVLPDDIKVLNLRLYLIMVKHKLFKKRLDALIEEKGLTYLYQNFDLIVKQFLDEANLHNDPSTMELLEFINRHRDRLFTNKLMVTCTVHTVKSKGKDLKLVDEDIKEILIAIFEILHLYLRHRTKLRKKEEVIFKAYKKYAEYIKNLINKKIKKKEAICRKNIYGTPMHFTYRAVCNPIINIHYGDEVYIPWSVGCIVLKFHLINVLTKKFGYKTKDAIKLIYESTHKFNPILDQCFKYIINNSKYKGLPNLLNRNPSILPWSIVLTYVTKVLPNARTLKISDLVIPNLNADFDGDSINNLLILES